MDRLIDSGSATRAGESPSAGRTGGATDAQRHRASAHVVPQVQHPHDYRADIDGLRAVAVLSVLAFHAFPAALPGGFTGVDIFFVISGFLISRIILEDLRKGRFTFTGFYNRRVRRIFPALTVVLATSLIIGWWILLPADFRHLGSHVAAGAGFVANLLLWSESGYFDTAAHLKPLLHLWSLGVEEQYYLVWPLALFLFRRHVHSIFWMILAVAVGSFALNVWATVRVPDAAFYLPPTRFWELMIGSIIAYAQILRTNGSIVGGAVAGTSIVSNALSGAGTALLVIGFVLLNDRREFPGWWALLPTLGAASIICAGRDAWLNRHVLSNKIVVYIGLISYPLYLWHWPLLTFARITNSDVAPPPSVRMLVLIGSVVLACLTYELIEKKIRRPRQVAWSRRVVPALSVSMAALAVYGLLAFNSISQARSAAVPRLAAISEAFDDRHYGSDTIIARRDSERTVLFFGDSHMRHYLPRIEAVMKHPRGRIRSAIVRVRNGCAPMPRIERPGRGCAAFVADAFRIARRRTVDTIVISASWVGFASRTDYYKAGEERSGKPLKLLTPQTQWVLDGFESKLRRLTQAGKKVVIVLDSPRAAVFDPRAMVKKHGIDFEVAVVPSVPRATVVATNAVMDWRLRAIAQRVHAILVNPCDALCTPTVCPSMDPDGNPLYTDEAHLRASTTRERFDLLDRFLYLRDARSS
jgi:peptidoglycan/LPS O-acetylase OafA/YrhL